MIPGLSPRRTCAPALAWLVAMLAIAGCGDSGGRDVVAAPAPAGFAPADARADAGNAAQDEARVARGLATDAPLPPGAISIGAVDAMAADPVLAAAARAAGERIARTFEDDARAAIAEGQAVDGWRLRLAWTVRDATPRLRVAEGRGEADYAGVSEPRSPRLVYDREGARVLALGDWFAGGGAWPVVARIARAAGVPDAALAPGTLAAASYEPTPAGAGAVGGFSVWLPAARPGATVRIEIPLAEVEAHLVPALRPALGLSPARG